MHRIETRILTERRRVLSDIVEGRDEAAVAEDLPSGNHDPLPVQPGVFAGNRISARPWVCIMGPSQSVTRTPARAGPVRTTWPVRAPSGTGWLPR